MRATSLLTHCQPRHLCVLFLYFPNHNLHILLACSTYLCCSKCLLLVLDRYARDLHDEDGDVVHGLGLLHVDLRPRATRDSTRLRDVSY